MVPHGGTTLATSINGLFSSRALDLPGVVGMGIAPVIQICNCRGVFCQKAWSMVGKPWLVAWLIVAKYIDNGGETQLFSDFVSLHPFDQHVCGNGPSGPNMVRMTTHMSLAPVGDADRR